MQFDWKGCDPNARLWRRKDGNFLGAHNDGNDDGDENHGRISIKEVTHAEKNRSGRSAGGLRIEFLGGGVRAQINKSEGTGPRSAQNQQAAAKGEQEIREGAEESTAQDAEDRAEEQQKVLIEGMPPGVPAGQPSNEPPSTPDRARLRT